MAQESSWFNRGWDAAAQHAAPQPFSFDFWPESPAGASILQARWWHAGFRARYYRLFFRLNPEAWTPPATGPRS